MRRTAALVALGSALAVAHPLAAEAQTVLVRLLDDASTPVFGALTYLVDPSGETVRNALSDERGRVLFVGVPLGTYRVRAEMIGMATAETELFDLTEGVTVSQDLRLSSSAIQLEGISVEADQRCRVRPGGEGLAVARVWDETRKALSAAAFTDERGSYRYETTVYTRELDRNFVVLDEERSSREGYMTKPFESLPADSLVTHGFVQPDGREFMYYAPDAEVLLSDVFLDTHCFRIAERGDEFDGLIALAFEPTGDNRRVVDIAGTMWIDEQTAELQWLEYRYEYLDPDIRSGDIGGRVEFQRLPEGTWIVPEWYIRMPAVVERIGADGRRNRYVDGYRQTGGIVDEVREAGGRRLGQRVQTGGFEGVVVDSVGVPIQGVRVGVVGSNQEVFTNAEGRYSITGVDPGRYRVRFVDPGLQDVGFAPEPVTRDVIRGESTVLDFHMPSLGDVLFDACRGVERVDGPAILAGVVVDRRGRPVSGATVTVEWSGYRFVDPADPSSIIQQDVDGASYQTGSDGAYVVCGVPTDTTIRIRAALGETESDVYTVTVGIGGFGATRTIRLDGAGSEVPAELRSVSEPGVGPPLWRALGRNGSQSGR
jgi:hypothetical protein